MPQPSAASSHDLAAEVPSLGRSALAGALDRPGFRILIPGPCLKPGSRLWTPEQRKEGVFAKGIFLSPSEELDALADAQRENKLAAVGVFQVIKSLFAVADVVAMVAAEGEEPDIAPGPWRIIPPLERRPYWDEFGPIGRNIFTQAYQLANTPEEVHRAQALRSFRVLG